MKIIQDKPTAPPPPPPPIDTSGHWNGMGHLALGFALFLGNFIGFSVLPGGGPFIVSCLIVGNVFTIRSIWKLK